MKTFTLIYDQNAGHPVADGKVFRFVEQAIAVFNKEGVYKSTFGNMIIVQEFLSQIAEKNIHADLIEIFYVIGDKTFRTVIDLNYEIK